MMNKAIENIAEREFGSNEFMVGFDKGIMEQAAGNTKAGRWKHHFDRFKNRIGK